MFLYETSLGAQVEKVRNEICFLINGSLKVLRVTDHLVSLACHGIAKDPSVRGLLEDQVKELKLVDTEADRCEPVGGFIESPDPVEFRVGKAPTGPFKDILLEKAKEIEMLMKNPQHFLTPNDIKSALKTVKDELDKVYPMGLPEYEPVRMELENREILAEYHSKELTNVADPNETKLWFASKELLPEGRLGDYMGKNEKTKVVVKVASKKSGQPAREPVLSEQEQKVLLMHNARRREEYLQMEKDADDSYLDAPWADQQGLKRKVLGLDQISWKPF